MSHADHAREVRNALTDPIALCSKLGLLSQTSKRQARGAIVCCPAHGERNPSCSVTLGPDGTVRVRCFGCDFSGDALTLVATVYGLSLSTNFREVLTAGAELAGHHSLADEIRGGTERVERKPVPAPAPLPAVKYPDAAEVQSLWDACSPANEDPDVCRLLVGRRIDPDLVTELDLARALPRDGRLLPRWAAYGGRSWAQTGHVLIVRAWGSTGRFESVRAWRVTDGDTPKRLPPKGHKSAELVQANRMAWAMLAGQACPLRLVVTEGEPDWAIAATALAKDDAVIGIGSGSWTADFARRVPARTEVIVATHADPAGDRYAAQVLETLGDRHRTWRWRMAA